LEGLGKGREKRAREKTRREENEGKKIENCKL
jgi:hypothetical protein